MLTEKDYCDYDTCVALKELGYCEPTLAYYGGFLPSKSLHYLVIDEDCMPEDGVNVFDLLSNSNKYKDSKFIDAPTMWEVQKWLREEKRICVEVDCCASGYVWELCKAYQGDWFSGGTTIYTHYCEDNANNPLLNDCGKYNSYEDALLEGIKEAVKVLKEKLMNT